MNSIERMRQFLKRKPHDRIPVYEHFWSDTNKVWLENEEIRKDDNQNYFLIMI